MNFVSNAAASLATRVFPAVAGAAMANPITAIVLTGGTVGLAAWTGSEVAVKSAPMMRALKTKVHAWSAPEEVKQAAKEAAERVQTAADEAAIDAAADAAAEEVAVPATRKTQRNGRMAA